METTESRKRLVSTLRAHGLPVTAQRRVVFDLLQGRTDHPCAETIFAEARTRMPDVSRTTVYRILEAFVRLGLVQRVDPPGQAMRFDPDTSVHHHLVCDSCHAVEDWPDAPAFPLPPSATTGSGFLVRGLSVQFHGVCSRCRP